MSWFTNVFGPVLRFVGIGKPKDIRIPGPLPGSESMKIQVPPQQPGTKGSEIYLREREAKAVLQGFVRAPYQITDREIRIACVSWDDGRAFFARYGYDPKNWAGSREGNFYQPKPEILDAGLIHLVNKSLDQSRRVFLALHEMGHATWHYLLTAAEWTSWNSRNWSYEEFADDFARRMMGDKLERDKAEYFDRLEKRLRETGTKAQRL